MLDTILKIEKLNIYNAISGKVYVKQSNIKIYDRKITAVIGSSGSGKSLILSAMLGVLPSTFIVDGHFRYNTSEINDAFDSYISYKRFLQTSVYGSDFGFVTQNPSMVLDNNMTVGKQLINYLIHTKYSKEKNVEYKILFNDALELLNTVSMPDIEKTWNAYTSELSGGMKQKLVIAFSLSTNPRVLFCDEPTSSLDIDGKFKILDIFKSINLPVVWVTHNLSLVSKYADILYAVRNQSIIGPIIR